MEVGEQEENADAAAIAEQHIEPQYYAAESAEQRTQWMKRLKSVNRLLRQGEPQHHALKTLIFALSLSSTAQRTIILYMNLKETADHSSLVIMKH